MNDVALSLPQATASRLPGTDPRPEEALALFGHDLRAALSDVIGGLRLIAPEALDTSTRVQIDRVRLSVEVLARLLDRGLAEMLRAAGAEPAEPSAPLTLDENRLHRLLEMAGPETGRDLLDRLISDLGGVQRGLTQAQAQPDWQAIRGHSHVLISLAGAVGAQQLQAQAEALNLLAHRLDRGALAPLMPGILNNLKALIDIIHAVRRTYPVQPE